MQMLLLKISDSKNKDVEASALQVTATHST